MGSLLLSGLSTLLTLRPLVYGLLVPRGICLRCSRDRAIATRSLCHTCLRRLREAGEGLPPKKHRSFAEWWTEVDKSPAGCWYWTGPKSDQGYGVASGLRGTRGAYTYAYELAHGPIKPGMTVDHMCHNNDETCRGGPTCPHRLCVRPDHLRAVTHGVNVKSSPNFWPAQRAAQTHGACGHALSGGNVYRNTDGGRECRTCRNARKRAQYHAAQQAKPPRTTITDPELAVEVCARLTAAAEQMERSREERDQLIRKGAELGVLKKDLARLAGLIPQSIYPIVYGRKPRRTATVTLTERVSLGG